MTTARERRDRIAAFDPTWTEAAACAQVDPELFFPEKGQNGGTAKTICAGCPVQTECLDTALRLNYDAYGIWGGTSEQDRRRILRKATA